MRLLSKFPTLQSLHLKWAYFAEFQPTILPLLKELMPNLIDLKMDGSCPRSTKQLVAIFGEQLETLSLHLDHQLLDGLDHDLSFEVPFPKLRGLEITTPTYDDPWSQHGAMADSMVSLEWVRLKWYRSRSSFVVNLLSARNFHDEQDDRGFSFQLCCPLLEKVEIITLESLLY